MSKKRAVGYKLDYTHYRSRPEYLKLSFLDKKGRTMISSVEVLINAEYFDEAAVNGFVLAR